MPQGWRFNGGVIGGGPHLWTATKGGVWSVKENYINRNTPPVLVGSAIFTTTGATMLLAIDVNLNGFPDCNLLVGI